ncbi:MAG TPA: hypothetical protein VH583_06870 [Vicinamibacterales bacterium]|jgi:hypothetical protein
MAKSRLFAQPLVSYKDAKWSVAALLHGVWWHAGRGRQIADGIRIAGIGRSRVGYLYRRLCKEQNVDDGDPLRYDVCLEFDHSDALRMFESLDQESPASHALNLLAVVTGGPIGACRMIWSTDHFKTIYATDQLFTYRPNVFDSLESRDGKNQEINADACRALAIAWQTEKSSGDGRLSRALYFFQHAWLSANLDVTCLNLAIVLETLCAPHSQSETSHQIAFNTAHLRGGTAAAKKETFALIRKFYGLRSGITHGGSVDQPTLFDFVPPVFHLCASLLRRLLLDPKLAAVIDDEAERRRLFAGFMFGDG